MFEMLRKAARQGYAKIQFNLKFMHKEENCVEHNFKNMG